MILQVQVLLLIGAASFIHACPNVNVIQDFDASQFAGRWYWTEWYNNGLLSNPTVRRINCLSSQFTNFGNGNLTATIYWKGVRSIGGRINGAFLKTFSPNYFLGDFPAVSPIPSGRYYVLDVGYNAAAVLFYCRSYGLTSVERAWILSRNKDGLTTRQRNKLEKRWASNPYLSFLLDLTKFAPYPATDCTEYRI